MNNPVQDSTKTAKQIAIDMARKAAREPLEVLSKAREQIVPSPDLGKNNTSNATETNNGQEPSVNQPQIDQLNKSDLSRVKELEAEMKEVHLNNLISELQQKISNGEAVYLEDYPQIPIEQKQVLKAQMQAVSERAKQESARENIQEPASKPSRRLAGAIKGMKRKVEQLRTKAETRMPPSG